MDHMTNSPSGDFSGRQAVGQYVGTELNLDYLIFLPQKYEQAPKSFDWPLILFLHGSAERGTDIDILKRHGIPRHVEEAPDFPFIAISPQCPPNMWWTEIVDEVEDLVVDMMELYRADTSRAYLTGISMGGYGVWRMAAQNPELFAAAAPICGGGDVGWARALKDVPIWAFHGSQDKVVPVRESIKMVEAVKKVGGEARLTIYDGVGHDSWTQTYQNPALYRWLLGHGG